MMTSFSYFKGGHMMRFHVFLCHWSVVCAYIRSVKLQRLKSQTQRDILYKSYDSAMPS